MTLGDTIILVLALCLLVVLYWTYWISPQETGSVAIIQQQGKSRLVDLNKDQIIKVKGPLGISVIQVHNGGIRFTQSPCKGKYCLYSGRLSKSGEVTACLPNGILLSIPGKMGYDTINF